MSETRENRMLIVTGRQRIGKSNETLRNMFDDIIPEGRKCLILDINNEYGQYKIHYSDGTTKVHPIKRIKHKDIQAFSGQQKIEIVRVIPVHDNGKPMSPEEIDLAWVRALRLFKGGVVLMEDINNIFSDTLPKQLSASLTNKAHRDADLIVHMQSVGRILPKMLQNAEFVRFHFQLDSIKNSEDKLKDEYALFSVAQNIVSRQYQAGAAMLKINPKDEKGNRLIRKYVYVNRVDQKIFGAFTKRMMYDACAEFLRRVPSEYSFMLKQVDSGGKKIYNPQDAMHKRALELLALFWGN